MDDRAEARGAPSLAHLRAAVRGSAGAGAARHALAALIEREPRGLDAFLRDIALDPEAGDTVRVEAAAALGRHATTSSADALAAATAADDPMVVRQAVAQLGRIGRPADLATLDGVQTNDPATTRVLNTAKRFLSYRHGLGEYRHDTEGAGLAAEASRAVPVAAEPLNDQQIRELLAEATPLPGVALSLRSGLGIRCDGGEYVLLLTDDFAAGNHRLADRQALPAVLFGRSRETQALAPDYWFMTDPVGEDRFHVFGVRDSGRVGLYGTGTESAGIVRFEVRATKTPLEPPLTVAGSYDVETGALQVTVAMTETRLTPAQRRLRRSPVPG